MSQSRGLAAADVLVGVVICVVVALLLLLWLPSARESSREVTCRDRLAKIGIAMALFDRAEGHLPAVPPLGTADAGAGDGPLNQMLEILGLADFDGLKDAKAPVPARLGPVPVGARVIAGFICPNDPNGRPSPFSAPVSYRANAGDQPDGGNGPFAPGRAVRLEEIEAGDGLAFTAAFSERLLGDGREGVVSASAYRVVPGPIGAEGCPPGPSGVAWRGDAGSSWLDAGWISTLYNHAAPPGAGSDCVAEDGRSAVMRASSSHREGVHVLRCDGSVGIIRSGVDVKVWRALGSFRDEGLVAPPGSSESKGRDE